MKKNMGLTDRIVRIVVAILIGILYYFNVLTGVLGMVLLAVAGIFVLTSFISICPIYSIFGCSSCSIKKKSQVSSKEKLDVKN